MILPSFLRLSGYDKSKATSYRINLYGAKKLQSDEREEKLKQFLQRVSQHYNIEDERENIEEYQKMDHQTSKMTESKAKKIISFYIQ